MEAWAFFVYLLPELITATSIFFCFGYGKQADETRNWQ